MTYRKFNECLGRTCSDQSFADNITGDIMDEEECWDWEAEIPEEYVKIHLGDI